VLSISANHGLYLVLLSLTTACGGETGLLVEGTDSGGTAGDVMDGGASPEVLYLPASSTTGATTSPLRAGVTYKVIIQGSVSVWPPADWSSVCAGRPSPSPLFSSPGATGPVGVDAEWVWAWPRASPSLCPDGAPDATPPVAERKLRIEASSGAPPVDLPPPRETEMTANHAYTYSVVGTGTSVSFTVNEIGKNPDGSPHVYNPRYNYGEFRIEVIPT
jgi:hypothetical protein